MPTSLTTCGAATPAHGALPASIYQRTHPKEKTSASGEGAPPASLSGDMWVTVPCGGAEERGSRERRKEASGREVARGAKVRNLVARQLPPIREASSLLLLSSSFAARRVRAQEHVGACEIPVRDAAGVEPAQGVGDVSGGRGGGAGPPERRRRPLAFVAAGECRDVPRPRGPQAEDAPPEGLRQGAAIAELEHEPGLVLEAALRLSFLAGAARTCRQEEASSSSPPSSPLLRSLSFSSFALAAASASASLASQDAEDALSHMNSPPTSLSTSPCAARVLHPVLPEEAEAVARSRRRNRNARPRFSSDFCSCRRFVAAAAHLQRGRVRGGEARDDPAVARRRRDHGLDRRAVARSPAHRRRARDLDRDAPASPLAEEDAAVGALAEQLTQLEQVRRRGWRWRWPDEAAVEGEQLAEAGA